MVYTLTRFYRLKPKPPFWLGGRAHVIDGRQVVSDATGSLPVLGLEPQIGTGEWLQMHIIAVTPAGLQVDQVERGVAPKGDAGPPKRHALRFLEFVEDVRACLRTRGLRQLQTPTLVTCPGLEPSLEPFESKLTFGRESTRVFLPTSPEIHLKKAMARGWTDVFEVKPCFRRGEFSKHHEAEFLMLEWYRGFADLEMILEDLGALIQNLIMQGWDRDGQDSIQLSHTDFATLFDQQLQFALKPGTTRDELAELARRLSLSITADDTFDDLFHRIWIDHVEPKLVAMGPTVVRRFPPSQAALAKLDRNGWADRFEFFWNGFEIANAFNEVTDPAEQRARWQHESRERIRLGTTPLPIDEELIQSLEQGLPPCGGIALGLERLYMAMSGVTDIQELKLFPTSNLLNR